MDRFPKHLAVGNTDTYTYTVDPLWIGSASIVGHVVTVDSLLTKNTSSVESGVIGASVTAVTAGNSIVHYEWTTSDGRTDCANVSLIVKADC